MTASFTSTMNANDITSMMKIVGANENIASIIFNPAKTVMVKSTVTEKYPAYKIIVNFFGKAIGGTIYTEKSKYATPFKDDEKAYIAQAKLYNKNSEDPKGKIFKYFEGLYLQIPDMIDQFKLSPSVFDQEKKKVSMWCNNPVYRCKVNDSYYNFKATPYYGDIIRVDVAIYVMLIINQNAMNIVMNSVFALSDSPKYMVDLKKKESEKAEDVGYIIYGVEKTSKKDTKDDFNYKLVKYPTIDATKRNTVFTIKIATKAKLPITMTSIEKMLGITDPKASVAKKSEHVPKTKEELIDKLKLVPSDIPEIYNAPALITALEKQKQESTDKRKKSTSTKTDTTPEQVSTFVPIKQKGVDTSKVAPVATSLLETEETVETAEHEIDADEYEEVEEEYEYEYEEVEEEEI